MTFLLGKIQGWTERETPFHIGILKCGSSVTEVWSLCLVWDRLWADNALLTGGSDKRNRATLKYSCQGKRDRTSWGGLAQQFRSATGKFQYSNSKPHSPAFTLQAAGHTWQMLHTAPISCSNISLMSSRYTLSSVLPLTCSIQVNRFHPDIKRESANQETTFSTKHQFNPGFGVWRVMREFASYKMPDSEMWLMK